MDQSLRDRVEAFVQPLYQDLDGVSRVSDIARLEKIARALFQPESDQDEHHFALLLLFSGLGRWLNRMGNVSRAALIIGKGVSESDLRRVGEAIRRLDDPQSAAERAVATAGLIDAAGARGLALRFSTARREGTSPDEIVKEELQGAEPLPDWLDERSRRWLGLRADRRKAMCQMIVDEIELQDLQE